MQTLFIADLHLSANRPDITKRFQQFMMEEAIHADALYVLGDLFEMWVGDDDQSPFHQTIIQSFRQLTESGVPCYFIHGNRDFLIQSRFAQASGITLLPEEIVIDLYHTPTLILHGDTLCTLDEKYQNYRKKVHQPWLQKLFLALPLIWRQKIGDNMRQNSQQTNNQKSNRIMDVTPDAVEMAFKCHGVQNMIHGHTHRPNVHHSQLQNTKLTRTVLGDWYEQGSVLICTPKGQTLEQRPFQVDSI